MREIPDGRDLARNGRMDRSGNKTGRFADLLSFFDFLSDYYEWLGGCADVLAEGNDCSFGDCCGYGRFVCSEMLVISGMHTPAECVVCFYGRGFHSVSPAIGYEITA